MYTPQVTDLNCPVRDPVQAENAVQSSQKTSENIVSNIDELLKNLPDTVEGKAAVLENVFETLKSSLQSLPKDKALLNCLHKVLDCYSLKICYNTEIDGDEEYGMKQSFRLGQWALFLKMEDGLEQIKNFPSLELLRQADAPFDIRIKTEVLRSKLGEYSIEEREALGDTIHLLTNAMQNIDVYTQPQDLKYHQDLYDTFKAIWEMHPDEKKKNEKIALFRYDKDVLLLQLAGESREKQTEKLEELRALFENVYGSDSVAYKEKELQILNRQVIHIMGGQEEDRFDRAIILAREGVQAKEKLLLPQEEEKAYEQQYYLANARQVFATCIAKKVIREFANKTLNPWDEEKKEAMLELTQEGFNAIEEACTFAASAIGKGKKDSYFSGYFPVKMYLESLIKSISQ